MKGSLVLPTPQLERLTSRSSQRGAAVFVVVLIITMLSALGLFAVRSAALANSSAGGARQMTQVHYVTEYGVLLAAGELAGDARQNYADEMRSQSHAGDCGAASGASNATCFVMYTGGFEKRIQRASGRSTETALAADGLGTSSTPIEGVVRVEMTELRRKDDIRGMALTGLSAEGMPRYFTLTVTSSGQVRPAAQSGVRVAAAHAAAGLETSQAHLTVGPLAP